METIDIIELLKRVKEGKAPQKIRIKGKFDDTYILADEESIDRLYYDKDSDEFMFSLNDIWFDTEFEVLDKPIIEELKENTTIGKEGSVIKAPTNMELMFKLNEIIRYINKGSDIE